MLIQFKFGGSYPTNTNVHGNAKHISAQYRRTTTQQKPQSEKVWKIISPQKKLGGRWSNKANPDSVLGLRVVHDAYIESSIQTNDAPIHNCIFHKFELFICVTDNRWWFLRVCGYDLANIGATIKFVMSLKRIHQSRQSRLVQFLCIGMGILKLTIVSYPICK
jgi:hypothetical protein